MDEKIIAAVDLGSNSFHMKIARRSGDNLIVIDRMREMVQLAAGLDESDQLSEIAAERAIDCLERFGQRLQGMRSEDIRAVGTNTLRKARNAEAFLTRAEEALDHPIEIISGREEARLIYLGVSHHAAQSDEQRLVVDIGGGSTEFIVGRGYTPLLTESLYMGCIGISRDHFPDGKLTPGRMRRAALAASQELEPIQGSYRRIGWDVALGCSGTILAVERILVEVLGRSDGITRDGLEQLIELVLSKGHASRLDFDIRPARARVLPGGLAILRAIMDALAIDTLQSTNAALREGLLYDLVGRLGHADVRESTIAELSRRYHIDTNQGGRIERTALYVRAQTASAWGLGKEVDGNMLSWAARLHEIGLAIAHNQYHKHGAYLLQHGDLPGFSREEQTLLAGLVRSHRRKVPIRELQSLRGTAYTHVLYLVIILRLAVTLHRSRIDDPLPPFDIEVNDRRIKLAFPEGWLEQRPLTQADLSQEAKLLSPSGVELTCESR